MADVKISELPIAASISGTELIEISQGGVSRATQVNQLVIPGTAFITVNAVGGTYPQSRQLAAGTGIQLVDNGAGSTIQIFATGTGALPGNPTALVSLAAINGVAPTWMRSDAAPAINQTITPTWTGLHTFTASGRSILASNTFPVIDLNETDAAADNRVWRIAASTEQMRFQAVNDAVAIANSFMVVDRTGATIDNVSFPAAARANFAGSEANPTLQLSSSNPVFALFESDAAANNGLWTIFPDAETLLFRVANDAGSAGATYMAVDRTANTVDSITWTATAATLAAQTTVTGTNLRIQRSNTARLLINCTDAPVNETLWEVRADLNGVFSFLTRTDADGAGTTWLTANRNGTTMEDVIFTFGTASVAMAVGTAPNTPSMRFASDRPILVFVESDAAVDNGRWYIDAQSEQFRMSTLNDAGSSSGVWLTVDRTGTTVDSISLSATTVFIPTAGTATSASLELNSATPRFRLNETDAAADNRLWDIQVAAERFSITTRSDAGVEVTAFAIERTGTTVDSLEFLAYSLFTLAGTPAAPTMQLSSTRPVLSFFESDAAANNGLWNIQAQAEQLVFGASNDAGSTNNPFMTVDRTAAVIDNVTFPSMASVAITHATLPQMRLTTTGAGANDKHILIRNGSTGDFAISTATDAAPDNPVNNFILGFRTGTVVDGVAFPAASIGSFVIGSSSVPFSSAAHIFQVAGAAVGAGMFSTTAAATNCTEMWNSDTAGDNSFIKFTTEAGRTLRGSIDYNRAGGLTRYNTTSDRRLKTSIVDAPSASAIIDAIRVRSFDWKDSNAHLDHWLVAQELYEIFPNAVSDGDNAPELTEGGKAWALDTSQLVPLMIKELQDLRARVRDLEKKPKLN